MQIAFRLSLFIFVSVSLFVLGETERGIAPARPQYALAEIPELKIAPVQPLSLAEIPEPDEAPVHTLFALAEIPEPDAAPVHTHYAAETPEPETTAVHSEPETAPTDTISEGKVSPFGEGGKEETSFSMQLLHMLATLGLLVSLVLLASWALKRMMRTRIQQVNQTSTIKIVEQRPLSSKTIISLIEVRGREFAVAESANGVTLLSQFHSQKEEEIS
jgi:flagellar biogenesis protein FliO